MNKYFDRLDYGRRLLYEPLKHSYSNEEIKAMLGFLITAMGYSEIVARNKVVQKVIMTRTSQNPKKVNKQILDLAKEVAVEKYDDVPPIKITEAEVKEIKKAETLPEQKILFIYLCYLRYRQALDGNYSDFYVYVPRQVFTENVGATYTGKHLNKLIFNLRAHGFLANKMGFTETKAVLFENRNSETAMEIKDLRGLGAVWTAYANPKYMYHKVLKQCVCCDTPFIDSATKNNTLYCSACRKLPQYKREIEKSEKC